MGEEVCNEEDLEEVILPFSLPRSSPPLSSPPVKGLHRYLGYYDGMGVIISIMIGSGIFASPGIVLHRAGSPLLVLLAWLLSGVIVMTTSLCYTELGSRYPSAGGDYEYLTRAYGKPIGFSFIWYYFWISKPGSQAIIATVFGDYFLRAFTGEPSSNDSYLGKLFSVSLILLLTSINCLGIKESSTVINILTLIKLLLIVFIAISGLIFLINNDSSILRDNFSSHHSSSPHPMSFLSSLIPCLWAYDGWADLNFLLEELKTPLNSRSLSLLVCSSITLVMICYLCANIAYFIVLPGDSIMNTTTVGLDYGQSIHRIAGVVMTLGIMFSTVGSAHGSILTGGRAFYAVARDGQAPHLLTLLNSRGAPYVSLIAQATWTIVLLLLPGSNYFSLLSYFGPSSWFYYALTGASLLVLRPPSLRSSGAPSGGRYSSLLSSQLIDQPWYSLLPPVFLIIISSALVIDSFLTSPFYCSLAFGFIFLSLPVWWCCHRWGYFDNEKEMEAVESTSGKSCGGGRSDDGLLEDEDGQGLAKTLQLISL